MTCSFGVSKKPLFLPGVTSVAALLHQPGENPRLRYLEHWQHAQSCRCSASWHLRKRCLGLVLLES